MMVSRVRPSMISVVFWMNRPSYYIFSAHSSLLTNSLKKNRSLRLALRPDEIAMEVAVSTLSPVNIQIWMPADFRSSMVLCTFSYSLSSTPVTPKKSNSASSSDTTNAMAYSLPLSFY